MLAFGLDPLQLRLGHVLVLVQLLDLSFKLLKAVLELLELHGL